MDGSAKLPQYWQILFLLKRYLCFLFSEYGKVSGVRLKQSHKNHHFLKMDAKVI